MYTARAVSLYCGKCTLQDIINKIYTAVSLHCGKFMDESDVFVELKVQHIKVVSAYREGINPCYVS